MAARESAEHGRRHGKNNVHPMTLEQLNADVSDLAVAFMSETPVSVVLRARELRDQTFELLDHNQWPQHSRELFLHAGRLCGLLAVSSSDFFGRYDAAATQCRTAWLCAEMADHNELRSWIRSLQSGIAFWTGRWSEAAKLAQNAYDFARTAPSATRGAALKARALARLKDVEGVRNAVAESEAARALPTSPETAGVMGFPEANRIRCAGTAYLWLGDHSAAQICLEKALRSYEQDEPDAYAHIMVARMDLAHARLSAGVSGDVRSAVDGAIEILQPALAMPQERRLAGVARRMSDLRVLLTRSEFENSQAARDLSMRIEQYRIYMTALTSDGE